MRRGKGALQPLHGAFAAGNVSLCGGEQHAALFLGQLAHGLLFALSFIPMALNLIYTAYFFSTKRTGTANAIAVSRGIALKALLIFCLPLVFGTEAIWVAPFVTEVITLAAAIVLSKTSKRVYR